MNLKTHIQTQPGPAANKDGLAAKERKDHKEEKCSPSPNPLPKERALRSMRSFVAKENGVALVITLLFLSVITFLAIAFLSMTRRDRSAVTATLDVDTARSMSDAALARAQTEIIAQMMAQTDILSYDYMASHNFINPFGFTSGVANSNNVNYDSLITNGGANNPNWATNIGNLFYDPRPPVFVMTNGNLAQPLYDFRFWVDINRNGRFETNGYQPVLDGNGNIIYSNGLPVTNFFNGEPEWIGVLKYPEYVHSPTNPFIGRYAFMALPIGKTLDLNFIHNYAKYALPSESGLSPSMISDGFIRDEGVGSWELNLAALLNDISPFMYQTNPLYVPYSYVPGSGANLGGVFYDASQFLAFRYGHKANFPQTLVNVFGSADLLPIGLTNIDEYGIYPATSYPFDYSENLATAIATASTSPWPGTYNSNMFYDIQDLFDTSKTGPNFASNLLLAVTQTNSYDRYTFQRLLACIGTSSAPEYGVYVYSNLFTNSGVPFNTNVPPPSWLRTKVNINYDNTAQIQAGPYSQTPAGPYGPYTPMPTNLTNWTPLGFFTNAADLLLRSQVFVFTNYVPVTNLVNGTAVVVYAQSNYLLGTFGITNIPVYNATNPGIVYNEQVHRMLQLAANIYAAANPVYSTGNNPYQQPPVFRPQFSVVPSGYGTNLFVTITGFVQVTNTANSNAYTQLSKGFYDLTVTPGSTPGPNNPNDPNFWGIPWVVGAVKGLPAFDQFSYQNRVTFVRLLQFLRYPGPVAGQGDPTRPPQYTNQYFMMSISNISGMDAWNPYTNDFYGSGNGLYVVASNVMTITLTNNYNWGTNITVANITGTSYSQPWTNLVTPSNPFWPGWYNPASSQTNMFKTFLQTNFVALPYGYYSESQRQFVVFTNGIGFLPQDTNQTTFPTHYWSMTATNHVYYALFDGNPASGANLLDFANLGPFGSSFPITQYLINNDQFSKPPYYPEWTVAPATDAGTKQISAGAQNQIYHSFTIPGKGTTFMHDIQGTKGGDSAATTWFSPPVPPAAAGVQLTTITPYANYSDSNIWMACDPLVHYTIGDLYSPSLSMSTTNINTVEQLQLPNQMTLGTGLVTQRYIYGTNNPNIVFADPNMTSANNWQFPTNLFPGVGWLGRVHRGTPWQTIYLKSDNPNLGQGWISNVDNYTPWVSSPYTYPTNDWAILDLFTAVPNDNAARGLLSVNQTNDAAWAAVFGGVIAITNSTGGIPISPTNDYYNFYSLAVDSTNGIYGARTNQPNGIFHKIGDILQASALTVNSPYVAGIPANELSDEMVERIPQQTLGLLKLGLPQFVIYSWGQSLKPKNLYSSGSGSLLNICTNYEITGEFLTRTVCHIVSDPGAAAPRIVIDNYNIMPGN
jgi:hypothetical protein